MREINLLLHFIGLGLLVTIQIAGFVLNSQYKKAPDLQTKAIYLRALRPIGLLSPVAILLMLITGIGNMYLLGMFSTSNTMETHATTMHSQGIILIDFPLLEKKIAVFIVAATLGIIMGIMSRKRGSLVASMVKGDAPQNANTFLEVLDKKIQTLSIVMSFLLLTLIYLSVLGRIGSW